MDFTRIKPAKLLLWLLAFFVPAQPVLAIDCPCNCRMRQFVSRGQTMACTASCSHSDHGSASCPSHCAGASHEHRVGGKTTEPRLARWSAAGYRPCQCPDLCFCHVRHELRTAFVSSMIEAPLVSGAGTNLGMAHPAHPWGPPAAAFGIDLHRYPSESMGTPLENCAQLCRFTI
jgi:hypothetical protein